MILLFLSVGLASPLQDCMAWLDGHPATELSRHFLSPPEPARRLDRYLDQGNRLLSQAQRRCSEAMRLDPAEVQLWIGDWLYDRGNRLRVLPAFQGAEVDGVFTKVVD
ncbi:MAG TPA: hypothetical protein PKW90_12125, partial [Myxococcota bacterium]|nr:hypothetical protein [Myxococcota bacterium]